MRKGLFVQVVQSGPFLRSLPPCELAVAMGFPSGLIALCFHFLSLLRSFPCLPLRLCICFCKVLCVLDASVSAAKVWSDLSMSGIPPLPVLLLRTGLEPGLVCLAQQQSTRQSVKPWGAPPPCLSGGDLLKTWAIQLRTPQMGVMDIALAV